jgi:integrase
MARIKDRWYKTVNGKKVKSAECEKGKRWQVQWTDDAGKDCKRNFELKAGKNPEIHAEAFRTKIEHDLNTGKYVSPEDANVTFEDFSRQWLGIHKTGDLNTDNRRERQLRLHVWPVIGERTLLELAKRPSIIQAWIQGMSGGASAQIITIKDVSSIFTAAMDDELIHRNPIRAQSVKKPTIPKNKAQPWPLAWIEGMSEELPKRFAVIPYLGAGSGMRQGEIFGLDVDDIDFLRRMINVNVQIKRLGGEWVFAQLKNKTPHTVPITETMCIQLSEHIKKFPPVEITLPWEKANGTPTKRKLLLGNQDGSHVRATMFNDGEWRPARRAVGIPDDRTNGMHAMRHTFASVQLASGIDIVSVAAYLGDTVAVTAKTYAHFIPGGEERSREATERFFQGEADVIELVTNG